MNNMCVNDYLMTNDYKSIALPAELQGLLFSCLIFSLKGQLNQSKNNLSTMLAAVAARSISASCGLLGTNLSAWSRYGNPASHRISKACFHPLKITKHWSGKYGNEEDKIYSS